MYRVSIILLSANSVIAKYEFTTCSGNKAIATFVETIVEDYYDGVSWMHPDKIQLETGGWIRASIHNENGSRAVLSVSNVKQKK